MKAMKKILSALPWALAVIAIIAAVAVCVYVGNEKIDCNIDNVDAEIAELQQNVADLQSKVDSLQGEIDSKYSGDGQRWEMEFKSEEMKQLIDAMPAEASNAIDIIAKDLFDQATGRIGDLWYGGTEFLPFTKPSVDVKIGHYTYLKCDMLYSDIVKIYSEIFTGEALDDYLGHRFADVDGHLYAMRGGGMSGIGVKNIKLTRVDETNDEIKYKVSYAHDYNDGDEVAGTCSMTIKLVNGCWRISEIDYIEEYWLQEEEYWLTHSE